MLVIGRGQHGSTYGGNPVAARVALAALQATLWGLSEAAFLVHTLFECNPGVAWRCCRVSGVFIPGLSSPGVAPSSCVVHGMSLLGFPRVSKGAV